MADRKWFHMKRLLRVADMLEGEGPYADVGPVPSHKFDMQWMYSAKTGGEWIMKRYFNPRRCNTAACALGWAKADPWFRKKGINSSHIMPSVFFGLERNLFASRDEFTYLFIADSYDDGREVSQHEVAARIREVAAR